MRYQGDQHGFRRDGRPLAVLRALERGRLRRRPARPAPIASSFESTQNVGSGGLGFRYKLASKFGMDVGIDVARSSAATAVYLVVGNAWFRP